MEAFAASSSQCVRTIRRIRAHTIRFNRAYTQACAHHSGVYYVNPLIIYAHVCVHTCANS